jgi:uncharacterized protein YegP (UPF0339 family)
MSRRLVCSLAPVFALALWLAFAGSPIAQDKKAPPAAALTVEVYQDRGDDFRFRIKSGDHILAIASKGYEKEADCMKVIEELKKDMGKATVVKMAKDKK